jgi:formiminotetrahydrofolate cyclodeaminase
MAAQFTVGKEGYGDVEADMRRLISEVADLRLHLLDLVEEDAAAYASLSVVLRMPKDEPKRVSELEEALKTSAAVPIDTMHSVCRVIELLEEVGEKGSRLLSSDVGCGASFASAALQAASLTVFVNTKISIDCQWAKQLESSCALMINEYVPRAQLVVEKMADRVRRRG